MYYGMYPASMGQRSYPDTKNNKCRYRITVNGKGRVTAIPDRASIVLGVVTEGSELKTIQQENAERMSQIIAMLKGIGIAERDIGTNSYNINMVYDYVDNERVFRGYRVTNTIKVEIKDIQKAGDVIDTGVSSGANLIENVEFTLSDPSSYRHRALDLAVRDAVGNAKAIANALNIVLDEIPVSVTEEANSYVPFAVKGVSTAFEAATPIQPGLIDIEATVKAVFTYRKV